MRLGLVPVGDAGEVVGPLDVAVPPPVGITPGALVLDHHFERLGERDGVLGVEPVAGVATEGLIALGDREAVVEAVELADSPAVAEIGRGRNPPCATLSIEQVAERIGFCPLQQRV